MAIGPATMRSTPSESSAAATPTTSTIASSGADLVELDVVGVDAVHRALGLGQRVEHGGGAPADRVGEVGRVEQLRGSP